MRPAHKSEPNKPKDVFYFFIFLIIIFFFPGDKSGKETSTLVPWNTIEW
jgi:hypothetical protein